MALGLKNLIVLNGTQLANGPIYRANPVCGSHGPDTGPQSPGKKVIKAGIAGHIWVGSFGHIYTITGHKPANQGSGECACLCRSHTARKSGQGALRQEVLRQYSKAVRHGVA